MGEAPTALLHSHTLRMISRFISNTNKKQKFSRAIILKRIFVDRRKCHHDESTNDLPSAGWRTKKLGGGPIKRQLEDMAVDKVFQKETREERDHAKILI